MRSMGHVQGCRQLVRFALRLVNAFFRHKLREEHKRPECVTLNYRGL